MIVRVEEMPSAGQTRVEAGRVPVAIHHVHRHAGGRERAEHRQPPGVLDTEDESGTPRIERRDTTSGCHRLDSIARKERGRQLARKAGTAHRPWGARSFAVLDSPGQAEIASWPSPSRLMRFREVPR